MVNYKNFYNAWHKHVGKKILLLENVGGGGVPYVFTPEAFLQLTTDPPTLAKIKSAPAGPLAKGAPALTVQVENGVAKIVEHEGRHRTWVRSKNGEKSILVYVNGEGVDGNIKQFIGQFSYGGDVPSLAVDGKNIRAAKYADIEDENKRVKLSEDPLDIGGGSKTVAGYEELKGFEQVGIRPLVVRSYIKNRTPDLTKLEYAKILNNLYSIKDNNGEEYIVVFEDPTGRGLIEFNVKNLITGELGNNTQTFTVTKK